MFIDQHALKNTIWAHMEQDRAQKKYTTFIVPHNIKMTFQ